MDNTYQVVIGFIYGTVVSSHLKKRNNKTLKHWYHSPAYRCRKITFLSRKEEAYIQIFSHTLHNSRYKKRWHFPGDMPKCHADSKPVSEQRKRPQPSSLTRELLFSNFMEISTKIHPKRRPQNLSNDCQIQNLPLCLMNRNTSRRSESN